MKTSYFNPEVHSLTFINYNPIVCGVSWRGQCGGMCTTVLHRFYDGVLIDCESKQKDFEGEIWNSQIDIVFKDIYKNCGWNTSTQTADIVSDRIDSGKPTLLYLDQVDLNLVEDHFVIAYAIEDLPYSIKKIYIYDPNYCYKRHYCNIQRVAYPYNAISNFSSWLELDYVNKKVTAITDKYPPINREIRGFKAYNEIYDFTHEKDIQHSCNIEKISTSQPILIGSTPVISHLIKISKAGNIPADLKLIWKDDDPDLFEQGDNLYTSDLQGFMGTEYPKHLGMQFGAGSAEKIYYLHEVYNAYNRANGTLKLQSNFLEKKLSKSKLQFLQPEITTFTAFADDPTTGRLNRGYDSIDGIGNILKIQGLNKDNVEECEKLPENYVRLPVSQVSFRADDYPSAIQDGTYDIYNPVFYLGYIKTNVVVELTENGLYSGATVIMTPDQPGSIENRVFVNQDVTFTLPGGSRGLYDIEAMKKYNFEVKGTGISSKYSETIEAIFESRCLIIHEPLVHKLRIEQEFDVFARYFLKILINIPHSHLEREWEKKFSLEFEKHQGIDEKEFTKLFYEKFIEVFTKEANAKKNTKQLKKDFIESFHLYDNYRKERTNFILNSSNNLKEVYKNLEILEDQLRPVIGKALNSKKSVKSVIKTVLKRKWN